MEFKLKRIKNTRAINVYSTKNYNNGMGDYIRGCFCMIQILRKKHIPFDMDISTHPIQRWFKPTLRYPYVDLEQINLRTDLDYHPKNRLPYIESKLYHANGLYTFFCNETPFSPITIEDRTFIRNKLLPSDEMKDYVRQTKEKWGIRGPYIIIHLRCGDASLVDGKPPNYDIFLHEIRQIIKTHTTYMILSDSLHMKERLRELYPHFIIPMDKPVHTCGCTDSEQIKDTVRDFFLFTTARQVYAFSVYGHGSGFSEWSCKLYDVPYHAKHIQ
jgi:hypothetical protein